MSWIVGLTLLAFCFWQVRRARDRAAEYSPTGLLRSPLHWIGGVLGLSLVGLVLVIGKMYRDSTIPVAIWAAISAIIVALLLIRHALKWRYPV